MACGCGGRTQALPKLGDTLGYRAILPGGQVIPPRDEVPYFSAQQALTHVTIAAGGTVRRIRRGDADDAYALAQMPSDPPPE
jgi:hypothetical protein